MGVEKIIISKTVYFFRHMERNMQPQAYSVHGIELRMEPSVQMGPGGMTVVY